MPRGSAEESADVREIEREIERHLERELSPQERRGLLLLQRRPTPPTPSR